MDFIVGMCDGAVQFVANDVEAEVFRAMLTKGGRRLIKLTLNVRNNSDIKARALWFTGAPMSDCTYENNHRQHTDECGTLLTGNTRHISAVGAHSACPKSNHSEEFLSPTRGVAAKA